MIVLRLKVPVNPFSVILRHYQYKGREKRIMGKTKMPCPSPKVASSEVNSILPPSCNREHTTLPPTKTRLIFRKTTSHLKFRPFGCKPVVCSFPIHHIYINCWFPLYRWSVLEKQVTSTPLIPENGGGGVLVTCIYITNHL